ncbi:HD-GYP domain, c-di-GMP phosphodiesterase class II (or its inactivated variant) [Andreprevotia lacus DSM 23236]|uniref:HD-GYP domain, c-di-GMP phosphodiesterase class II (Or its inactivated variant) n=1 Tax=Andreprevotia lacus DSM 23236 TaxID=1121001 RepID=A0A1W1X7G4_9NEIS|nr:HD domain-containing phosphohydrolase [Andreprevotia lacus]SMC19892.1 HD-GYP domain, c-di-GMP phosphodiesterase class II (or its inactivated variant) [Andreprevotia lacus DSM 23236]
MNPPAQTKPPKRTSIAQVILGARARLADLLMDRDPQYFQSEIIMLAAQIQSACTRNRNVALAMTLLAQDTPYAPRHAVDVGVVVELALKRLGQTESERRPVIAAALTMNIGMQTLQEQLDQQSGPLTTEQRQIMQQHPLASRDELRARGVSDTVWLNCVLQHHETPDGRGYPGKLRGDQLRFEARLLGLADRYCALLSKRAWRSAKSVDSALAQSISPLSAGVDDKLDRLFMETLGFYPPGSVVQLYSGEIGVVKRPGSHELTPVVQALYDADMKPLAEPGERTSGPPDGGIMSVFETQFLDPIPPVDIWGEDAYLPDATPQQDTQ